MRKLLAAGLLLLVSCGHLAPAQAQGITRICIQVVRSDGNYACVDNWTPLLLNGLSGTVTAIKASNPGVLGTVYCYNPTGAVAYIQLFDVATAAGVTLGTTKPKLSLGIPSALASGLGPAIVGVEFQNGIQAASTTTATGASGVAMDCNVTFN